MISDLSSELKLAKEREMRAWLALRHYHRLTSDVFDLNPGFHYQGTHITTAQVQLLTYYERATIVEQYQSDEREAVFIFRIARLGPFTEGLFDVADCMYESDERRIGLEMLKINIFPNLPLEELQRFDSALLHAPDGYAKEVVRARLRERLLEIRKFG